MKKRNDNKKKIPKIKLKKKKNSTVSKQISQREPDLWKEISSKLQPLIKTYSDYRKKQKIAKIKEEQRRIKMEEKQRLKEEETQILIEQEERKLKKEKRLKAAEERRLKEQEEQRLKKKRIKEDQKEREKQALIYKERLAKGEKERLVQLEEVRRVKEEEKKLIDVRNLMRERRLKKEQRLKAAEEQRLKEEKRRIDEQKKKRLNGKVKWFNGTKGYGFIKIEGEKKDIFVHVSAVNNSGLKSLKEGELLTFEIDTTDKGLTAINLRKTH